MEEPAKLEHLECQRSADMRALPKEMVLARWHATGGMWLSMDLMYLQCHVDVA